MSGGPADEITPMSWKLLNLFADPGAGDKIVEETDTVKLVRNGNGALLRWRTDGSGAPEHVDFLVKERKGWKEHIRPEAARRGTLTCDGSISNAIGRPGRIVPQKTGSSPPAWSPRST